MTVRQSNELAFLAREAGKREEEINAAITGELSRNGMIGDQPGAALRDCIRGKILVHDVANAIKAAGIRVVKSKHVDAFLALEIAESYN